MHTLVAQTPIVNTTWFDSEFTCNNFDISATGEFSRIISRETPLPSITVSPVREDHSQTAGKTQVLIPILVGHPGLGAAGRAFQPLGPLPTISGSISSSMTSLIVAAGLAQFCSFLTDCVLSLRQEANRPKEFLWKYAFFFLSLIKRLWSARSIASQKSIYNTPTAYLKHDYDRPFIYRAVSWVFCRRPDGLVPKRSWLVRNSKKLSATYLLKVLRRWVRLIWVCSYWDRPCYIFFKILYINLYTVVKV